MHRKILIGIIALALTALSAPAAACIPGVCPSGAKPLFSCSIGHQTTSICMQDGTAVVTMRHGKAMPITAQQTTFAYKSYAAGGKSQVAFSTGQSRFTIVERMVRTEFGIGKPNYPDITIGILEQHGEHVSSFGQCDHATLVGNLGLVQPYLPVGEFVDQPDPE